MQKPTIAPLLPMLMLGASNRRDTKQISIVINQLGRVRYQAADGEKEPIRSGAVLLNTGALQLSGGASALLFGNGRFVQLKDEGQYALEEVIPAGGMQKLNFDTRFGRYVMAAIDLVVHAGDGDAWGALSASKGGGDGWGELSGSKGGKDGWGELSGSKGGKDGWGELSGSKGGRDGWGEEDGRIVPIMPFGKLTAGPVIFQWSRPQATGQSYSLEILDGEGGIVHSTAVSDNWAQVNLNSLPLKPDQSYAWRINVPDHPEHTSARAGIQIVEEKGDELIEQKLDKSDAYQLQDPVLDGLMEAVVLEEAEHFYEAHQRYEMLRQSYKKNNLVKLMQAAFYLRHQLRPEALGLFRGKGE